MNLNFFKNHLKPKTSFSVPPGILEKQILKNREILNEVQNWIDDEAFSNSVFDYGVPDFIKIEINKKINNEITYTDLITFISNTYFKEVNYLEIGLSVGKNFFQVLKGVDNLNNAYGLDIEEINPVLERKLKYLNKKYWNTLEKSIKKTQSSLCEYEYNNKIIRYLSADIWDENSWSKLKGEKFNFIFSDALHTPEAILFEFEMIIKNDLLSDQFVIMWDDLVGEMQGSFFEIIKKYNKKAKIKDVYLLSVNGWVGEHEIKHSVGMISNFKL